MTPERRIQNLICSWLSLHKHHCIFNIFKSEGRFDVKRQVFLTSRDPYRKRGWADIIGIWKGKPLAIEVKSKTGRLSPEQKQFLIDFEAQGGIAFMARSLDDVIARLEPKDKTP